MTLDGGNAPVAKVNKNYGAQLNNFNEDRLMLSAAKCRPAGVVSQKYKVYADMYCLLPRHARQSTVMRLYVIFSSV